MLRRCFPRHAVIPSSLKRGHSRDILKIELHQIVHGFQCCRIKDFPELHLKGYLFSHLKTGAEYLHFDSDDSNNAFCIGFSTPANNNKGTTHVLEHTTLCGSKKFPVRDPFFHMLRRSLNTFMNAMTGPEYTMYPFSTTNATDYNNLLSVYLDAVFFPLLRAEDFQQEGHRIELAKPDEGETEDDPALVADQLQLTPAEVDDKVEDKKAIYNGIVYNEMRGCVSDPGMHFLTEWFRANLPKTHYQYLSGGYPSNVLELTHEELVAYHAKHYHPSNSVSISYGDLPPFQHMKLMDEYYAQFEKSNRIVPSVVAEEAKFQAPHRFTLKGPPEIVGDPMKQKRVMVSYLLPKDSIQPKESTQYHVLASLLISGPNSPMYKALISPQIGTKYGEMTGHAGFLTSPILSVGIEGVNEEDPIHSTDKIEETIVNTLEKAAEQGFDQRRVDSQVFQEELQQRHRSSSYGVNLVTSGIAMGITHPSVPIFDILYSVPDLKEIQKDPKILQDILRKSILPNKHRVTMEVTVEENFMDGMRAEIEAKEGVINESLTIDDKKKLQKDAMEWISRVRAPQNATVLPSLAVSDIPKDGFLEPPVQNVDAAHPTTFLIPTTTNGLVYVNGLIPLQAASVALMKNGLVASEALQNQFLHSPLCHSLFTKCGTAQTDFKEMEIAMKLTLDGLGFGFHLGNCRGSISDYIAGDLFSFYTTVDKLEAALDLLYQFFTANISTPRNEEERARFLSLMKGRASSVVQSIQEQANVVAVTKACSQLAPSCMVDEIRSGITQVNNLQLMLQALQDGTKESEEKYLHQVTSSLKGFSEDLQTRLGSTTIWTACEKSDEKQIGDILGRFQDRLHSASNNNSALLSLRHDINGQLQAPRHSQSSPEEVPLRIDTSYVGFAKYTGLTPMHEQYQIVTVACQLLKNLYLHRKVREEGGAYGSGAAATLRGDSGGLTMSSYRDPTPHKTMETFQGCQEWLDNAEHNYTNQDIDEAKLRLFAGIDAPTTPDQFGALWFCYDAGYEQLQKERKKLLAVTREEIASVASKYFSATDCRTAILCPEKSN